MGNAAGAPPPPQRNPSNPKPAAPPAVVNTPAPATNTPIANGQVPTEANNDKQSVFKEAVKTAKSIKKDELTIESLPIDPLKEVMKQLATVNSINDPDLIYALSFLSYFTSASAFGEKIATSWCRKVATLNYTTVLLQLWPSFFEPDNVLLTTTNGTENNNNGSSNNNNRQLAFRALFRILLNATELSPELCKATVDAGLIEKMLEMLSRPELEPDRLKDEEHCVLQLNTFRALNGILYNCLRQLRRETKLRFRQARGTEIYAAFHKLDKVPVLKAKVIFVDVLALNEDEFSKKISSQNTVEFLVQTVLFPTANDEHHKLSSAGDTIHAREIVVALNLLAKNETIAEQLVQLGVLDSYVKLQKSSKSTAELLALVNGYWQLSFCRQNQELMRKNTELMEALESLTNHKKSTNSRAVNGAIWNISGRGRAGNGKTVVFNEETLVAKSNGEGKASAKPILISFSSSALASANFLKDQLNASGFRTQAVTDKRETMPLDKMSSAVEKAPLILACVSEDYQDSMSCRQELEYALKLNIAVVAVAVETGYTSSGWLKVALGQQPVFQSDQFLSSAFDNILTEIKRLGIVTPLPDIGQFKLDPKIAASSGVALWSKQDVADWLHRSSQDEIVAKFQGIDGPLLVELFHMLNKAPSVFYTRAEKDLGISSLEQMLALAKALRTLPA